MPSEILPRLATLACLLAATASADQLVLQNFDALPVQTVADGASATIGASPRTLSLLSSAGTGIRILETSAGNKKLRFTDNQHGGAAPTMTSAVFSGVGGGVAGQHRHLRGGGGRGVGRERPVRIRRRTAFQIRGERRCAFGGRDAFYGVGYLRADL